jgi:type I restriction enzyme S subunit
VKVPKGWQVMRMNEAGLVDAGRQRSPHLVAGKSRPYLRVANVLDGIIDTTDVKQMPFTDDEFERFKLQPGDILLNEGQSLELVGRPAVYRGVPPNCCFQNTLVRFRARDGTDTGFALQLFKHFLISGRFAGIASKTTSIAHLGVSRFAEMRAAFPPHKEQKKVAQILSGWDSASERLDALVALKHQRLLALRQHLLTGETRFPQFKKQPWQAKKVGDLLKPVNRYEDWNDQRIFKLAGVRRNSGGVFFRAELPGHKIKVKVCKKIHANDFLISRRQVTWGGMSIVPPEFHGYDVNDEYEVLQVGDPATFDMRFFHYLSQTATLKNLAYLASNGVFAERLRLNFDLKAFLNQPIRVPPTKAEQLEIVTLLDACVREIRLLEAELEALKQQKRGLMQKLLTGEIRVKT